MPIIQDPDMTGRIIMDYIDGPDPMMISRLGSNELQATLPFLEHEVSHSPLKYIKGETHVWWLSEGTKNRMFNNAGFFPPTTENIKRFAERMLKDIKEVDVLGCWQNDERFLLPVMSDPKLVRLRHLEPFWSKVPWTKSLEGKKVLIIHPFADSILKQYQRHLSGDYLFKNPDTLPQFQTIDILPAVQSIGSSSSESGFNNWFDALSYMESEIDRREFDVCLIGCGAYGLPLAAQVKRQGKKAIHLGGALQLLFGIKGTRWEHNSAYSDLIQPNWIRPSGNETISSAKNVEGGCYW